MLLVDGPQDSHRDRLFKDTISEIGRYRIRDYAKYEHNALGPPRALTIRFFRILISDYESTMSFSPRSLSGMVIVRMQRSGALSRDLNGSRKLFQNMARDRVTGNSLQKPFEKAFSPYFFLMSREPRH